MNEVVITAAARTAVGRYGGSLKGVAAHRSGRDGRAGRARARRDRSRAGGPGRVRQRDPLGARGHVHGARGRDEGRASRRRCRRSRSTGCAARACRRSCPRAQTIATGEADVAVAGGAESMSRGPYWMPDARWGARMGDTGVVDPVVGGLTDPFDKIHMGVTAENLAESHDISREQQDEFSVESHQRARARAGGGPVRRRDRAGRAEVEEGDERVRRATSTCAPTRRSRGSAS